MGYTAAMPYLNDKLRADLAERLIARLRGQRCDDTLRNVRAWAAERSIPFDELARELAGAGGHCDCETLDNVVTDPEDGPVSSRL